MFRKVGKRDSRYLAKLVTGDRAPCAFCRRDVDDEVTFGKLYAIGDIQCHYLCALLSCCLVQKGPDEEGLFGFMYKDILTELERSKKHKCSFCGCAGANLGCSVSSCRKQFHLPCGREKNAVSLFHGSFKSFCQIHAPKQRIPDHIMCKATQRMKDAQKKIVLNDTASAGQVSEEGMVCVICYEAVDAFPTVNTFWPPCCGKDAWFHRSCLQRMALSAGMHYLKCPLCNDKEHFYNAVESQGYYVPDRDAAWELEQNAFAEIYERPLTCTAESCQCPQGRSHDADQGMWDIKLCLLCGSVGAHAKCIGASETTRYVCLTCTPAAPADLQALADTIEKLILEEQAIAASNVRHGPVMPSRMSLRRTKGPLAMLNKPSGSREHNVKTESSPAQSPNILSSRLELNLRTPRKLADSYKSDSPRKSIHTNTYTESNSPTKPLEKNLNESWKNTESYKNLEARLLSPLKHLEQSFKDKVMRMGGDTILDDRVVDILRSRFNKPRPLSEKKKIIDDILNGLFDNCNSPLKQKEPMREWCSPKKCSTKDEEKNQTTASENGTEPAENTVKNIENCTQDTPRKSKMIDLNASTPNKEQITSRLNEIEAEDVATNKDSKTGDDKHVVEENNHEVKRSQVNKENHHKLNNVKEIEATNDDSSNSTFQLPSEFIAEAISDDSCMTFQSPKRKTIELNDSSLELSICQYVPDQAEQDHSVNTDLIKINDVTDNLKAPVKQKSAFRFSRLDTETLDEGIVGMDLESFKKEYLNEVDTNYKCCFKHNHDPKNAPLVNVNFRTVIDFAIEAHLHKAVEDKPSKKRNLSESSLVLSYDKGDVKRRKISENILNSSFSNDDFENKKEFPSPVKKVENTVNKVSDKNKGQKNTTTYKKKERENRKRKQIEERKKSNRDRKMKTEDRCLLNRKLESKEKRAKDQKVETEERLAKHISSNDEKKKIKDHDKSLTEENVKNRYTKEKHENQTPKSKETIIKNNTENESSIQFNSNKIKRDKERNLLNKKEEKLFTPIKEQRDKGKRGMRDEEKRKKGKKRDGKDKHVKHKIRSNQADEKRNKNKLKIIDEKTASSMNIHKHSDKYTEDRKHDRKNTEDRKHGRKSEKYLKDGKTNDDGQNIEVTIDSSERKSNKKTKTKLSISNREKDISVKIKWRKKLLRLKIESKKDKSVKVEKDDSKFKQYVLQYFSEITPKEVLVKPEQNVGNLKRKYVKKDKTPDKLKQMSIQNFFKVKSPE